MPQTKTQVHHFQKNKGTCESAQTLNCKVKSIALDIRDCSQRIEVGEGAEKLQKKTRNLQTDWEIVIWGPRKSLESAFRLSFS